MQRVATLKRLVKSLAARSEQGGDVDTEAAHWREKLLAQELGMLQKWLSERREHSDYEALRKNTDEQVSPCEQLFDEEHQRRSSEVTMAALSRETSEMSNPNKAPALHRGNSFGNSFGSPVSDSFGSTFESPVSDSQKHLSAHIHEASPNGPATSVSSRAGSTATRRTGRPNGRAIPFEGSPRSNKRGPATAPARTAPASPFGGARGGVKKAL